MCVLPKSKTCMARFGFLTPNKDIITLKLTYRPAIKMVTAMGSNTYIVKNCCAKAIDVDIVRLFFSNYVLAQ